jgi:hypothetical protein
VVRLPVLLNANGESLLGVVDTAAGPSRSGIAKRSESLALNDGNRAAKRDGIFITWKSLTGIQFCTEPGTILTRRFE